MTTHSEAGAAVPAYSFKRRFVSPIRVGLGTATNERDGVVCGIGLFRMPKPKTQTIRQEGKRRHAREGEVVQLYHAQRTKQCFLIGLGLCTAAPQIRLYIKAEKVDIEGRPSIKHHADLDRFSERDGFLDWTDMRAFWRENHPDVIDLFLGRLVEWQAIGDQLLESADD